MGTAFESIICENSQSLVSIAISVYKGLVLWRASMHRSCAGQGIPLNLGRVQDFGGVHRPPVRQNKHSSVTRQFPHPCMLPYA